MGMSPGNRNEFKRSPLVNPHYLWNYLAPLCASWLAALILIFKLLGRIKTPPLGWHKAPDVLLGLGPLTLRQLWTIRCLFLRDREEQGSVWLEAGSEWQVERKEQTAEHVVRPHHTGRTTGAGMVWGAGWRSSKAHTAEQRAERMVIEKLKIQTLEIRQPFTLVTRVLKRICWFCRQQYGLFLDIIACTCVAWRPSPTVCWESLCWFHEQRGRMKSPARHVGSVPVSGDWWVRCSFAAAFPYRSYLTPASFSYRRPSRACVRCFQIWGDCKLCWFILNISLNPKFTYVPFHLMG